jgi:DnaJ-class molecular chaperone
VASLYATLDDINARIAEHRARQNAGDRKSQEAAKQARAQANESQAAVDLKQPALSAVAASEELKRLYREVAKRVHPDLSTDSADRVVRERLMSEANRAYEIGDLERLRQILEEYETSPETVKGEGTGAELVRVIRKITQVKKRLNEIEKEVERVSGSEMAKLQAKSEEYEKRGRDLLGEMAAQVEVMVAVSRRLRS